MEIIDLVNRALARLGVETINNMNDPSTAAKRGSQLYQPTVDSILRQHPWACAVREVELTAYAVDPWVTLTAYVAGDKVLSNGIIYICITGGTSGAAAPDLFFDNIEDGTVFWDAWEREPMEIPEYLYRFFIPDNTLRVVNVGSTPYRVYGPFIYTNEEEPSATVIRRIENPDLLDSMLQDAIVALLAKHMAPSFGKDKMNQELFAEYLMALQLARAESSAERQEVPASEPYWTDRI